MPSIVFVSSLLILSAVALAAPGVDSASITGGYLADDIYYFSPNDDGNFDSLSIDLKFNETSDYEIAILNSSGTAVRSFSGIAKNPHPKLWDGRNFDGTYTVQVTLENENGVTVTNVAVLNVDTTSPATTKTYSDGTEGLFGVETCDGIVPVNVHFITTDTTITLDATDSASGVADTFYSVLVPADCFDVVENDEWDESEWAGLEDNNLYLDASECASAVEGGQECVETFWNFDTENATYDGAFTIEEESVHKICFFSQDNTTTEEDLQCQIALVDDNAPVINSAELDHEMVDLEYYEGGAYNYNYFDDPKCTVFTINATDTHEIDEVSVNVQDALTSMFYPQITELPSFDEVKWEDYLADDMHNRPSLSNGFVEQVDANLYEYQFCPQEHIYHLYDMDVIGYNDFGKFLSEKLVLGSFEFPVTVNDTAGKESSATVDLAIVDLTVPLDTGWNLRSTPLALEGDEFWNTDGIDAVLRFDSETQSWELVTDSSMEPLDALYMHATERNQYGIIFDRDLTSPPLRELQSGWNLVGLALEVTDYWYNPSYYGYLTYLYDDNYACVGEDALNPVVFDSNGNTALEMVISPYQYLSYSDDDDGSWYFYQYQWIWIPEVRSGEVRNDCDEYVQNFGGYWLFMQNTDILPGQTVTPLPLSN